MEAIKIYLENLSGGEVGARKVAVSIYDLKPTISNAQLANSISVRDVTYFNNILFGGCSTHVLCNV